MSLFDRIKRKIPVVGGEHAPSPEAAPAAAPPPVRRSAPLPTTGRGFEPQAPPSGRGGRPVDEFLAEFVKSKPVVLFMKGSPEAPMCGFSANAAGILRNYQVEMATFDVLSDGDVRQGIKDFSQWPTIPQIYIGGEFVGGSDILMQMHQSGELREMLDKVKAQA